MDQNQCFCFYFKKSTQLPDLCLSTGLVTPSLIPLTTVTGQKGGWAPGQEGLTPLLSQGHRGCSEAAGRNVGGVAGKHLCPRGTSTEQGTGCGRVSTCQTRVTGPRWAASNPRSGGLQALLYCAQNGRERKATSQPPK